ncbi:MAG: hypothetical protein JWN14_752 [Chthonomonadales bacterium]|nr:hypothetical protein [Chthonomonadales bacterium]
MATITLTPELEKAMTEQARLQGTTLEMLAIDKLNAYFLPSLPAENTSEGETMADFLKDFIGCIDSREVVPGGANISEYSGRKLGEILIKKHRVGNLMQIR